MPTEEKSREPAGLPFERDIQEMERKLVQRVKLFKFQDKDVATVTTTKPIDFFPA